MLIYKSWGTDWKITFKVSSYANNGNLAISMIDWNDGYAEPYASLTVNLGDRGDTLPMNQAYVDTNNLSGIEAWIQKTGIGKFTGHVKPSGFCVYPLYEFDLEKIAQHS